MFKFVFKSIILTISCIVFIIGLNGCIQREVNLEAIGELIFDDVEILTLSKDFPRNSYALSANEIEILRNSILNGSELSEYSEDITPKYFNGGFAVFHITKVNKSGGTLVYEKTSRYMYVRKVLVHDKHKKDYEKRQSLFNKYLMGVYKFRPSDEIEKLVK